MARRKDGLLCPVRPVDALSYPLADTCSMLMPPSGSVIGRNIIKRPGAPIIWLTNSLDNEPGDVLKCSFHTWEHALRGFPHLIRKSIDLLSGDPSAGHGGLPDPGRQLGMVSQWSQIDHIASFRQIGERLFQKRMLECNAPRNA